MSDATGAVSHERLTELVRQAPLSFRGTVTRIGGTSLAAIPVEDRNERTAVVKVDEVLHAPAAFRQLAGSEVTVQLAPDADLLSVGDSAAFFTQGLVYGEGLGVTEIGRLPAGAVQRHVALAATTADELPFSSVQRTIRNQDIAAHAASADAVVLGSVVGLEDLGLPAYSEHAPHWWRATIEVSHVETGPVEPGRIAVLYPSSEDIRWRQVPKPQAGQLGLWLLHATRGELEHEGPYQLLDGDDYQPAQKLAVLQEGR
ncbi:hypothetical protein GCM10018790_71540 [Kitasatospora xanthocidica]|uniref:hypothetical protein n=1 Tax=Kitasatospora xanthocidica TaxID=83382 RepID=UPI001673A5FB|nr:hypothetical protein [Kitasatospora xanthocidica]GHF83579.1 hypothetical protein GCM10018790_71540 [Kitasatospora xanthocidica]